MYNYFTRNEKINRSSIFPVNSRSGICRMSSFAMKSSIPFSVFGV